ncbi:MAG: alpha-N-arabinofuranosidase [Novosphingobium sp.]|nr:alpha-N-arabinofuranosidase [Novosphingobium sp.]
MLDLTASLAAFLLAIGPASARQEIVSVDAVSPGPVIDRNIFGQFAEQLGEGIYGGVWVGPDSPIPNVRGIRSDVVAALRELKVPNVRWPGGCFADSYNWRDGIGPADKRPVTYNINWGEPLEPNTFGTHEFMDFVEQIGSEAYLSVNVGSGTPREAAQWLEYMTSPLPTTLTLERKANGRDRPYRVKFLGVGNEVWACGGQMSAETYLGHLRTYSHYVRNLNPAQSGTNRFMPGPEPMQRIAVGPGDDDRDFTEVIMKAWKAEPAVRGAMEGLSLHHYTMGERGAMRDPATGFGEGEYGTFIKNAFAIDRLISEHSATMDRYDPNRKVALVIDEWGAWLQPMDGTPALNLKQQNSMRDALVAAIHLNVFARHADRVRMANIAQMVNVLQAMVLTDGAKMVRTPTYHVFRMYVPFQDARLLPVSMDPGEIRLGEAVLPRRDAIAARAADGSLWLSVVNIDPQAPTSITLEISGVKARRASGEVLSAARFDAINTFDQPDTVAPRAADVGAVDGKVRLSLPPASVAVVKVELDEAH